ncbi:Kinase, NEK [Giardia muris]|uniref:Kinase, NEK n=1 Tax=Giardia muris TaxID=5742 RepID=A0A4Z1SU79_GIAMU|nr:Kinase, NEK [Giardia muris]|eukprot:TNJ28525.1 Kinase, NEK [Giardia muris]
MNLNPLSAAAYYGSARDVRALIGSAGVHDLGGKTALMFAAGRGYVECVRQLVVAEKGKRTPEGLTALMLAAGNDHASVVQLLIQEECGMSDSDGRTALMHAVLSGSSEAVKLLASIERMFCQKSGWTALMYAAYWGRENCVPFLLGEICIQSTEQYTTELGDVFPGGVTALMIAAARGHYTIASLLYDAERDLCDNNGNTAAFHARNGTDEIRALFNHSGASIDSPPVDPDIGGITPLMHAAEMSKITIVRAALKHIGKVDAEGRTALMRAIHSGCEQAIELLAPIEGSIRTRDGQSIWAYAIASRCFKSAHVFSSVYTVQHDDLHFIEGDEKGGERYATTPLMLAARFEDSNGVKKYMSFARIRNEDRKTALMFAAEANSSRCVVELLPSEQGQTDMYGWSALAYAIAYGAYEVIPYLWSEFGIRTTETIRDIPAGSNALRIAEVCQRNHQNLAPVFMKCGISISETDDHVSEEVNGEVSGKERFYSVISDSPSKLPGSTLESVEQVSEVGRTRLMDAAADGDVDKVFQLRFSEFGQVDNKRNTALIYALEAASPECVKYLTWEAWVPNTDALERAERLAEGRDTDGPEHKCLRILREIKPLEPKLPESIAKNFRIIGLIGRGAFATLYVCENAKKQRYALRAVCHRNFSESAFKAISTEGRECLGFECQYILKYHDVIQDKSKCMIYFLMDLCTCDLEQMSRRTTNFSDEKIWKYISQISEALVFLHSRNLIHRDIKLENVFLDANGNCKLGDFGFLRSLEPSGRAKTVVGTKCYMAPEIINDTTGYTEAVDIWAFGVLIYVLCTKTFPFKAADKILRVDFPPIPGRPQELTELVRRMLKLNPDERPTAKDILRSVPKH